MDPHSGKLYDSLEAAKADGVRKPTPVKGAEFARQLSSEVKSANNRAERRRIARKARLNNDGRRKNL